MPLCHQISLSRLARQYSRTDPVSRLGSYIVILVIVIGDSLGIHGKESSDTVRSPFRVLWNIPDYSCGDKYDYVLRKSGVAANKDRSFVGDEIATLYNPGLWPYFANNDMTRSVNGGIPQYANLTAHLAVLKQTIEKKITDKATGYGVIDMELWRALYDLNYSGFRIYRWASEDKLIKAFPQQETKRRSRKS